MVKHHLISNRAVHTYIALIAILLLASIAHGGGLLLVDDDAPLGGDGKSWDSAYRFLADALVAAGKGQVGDIRVAQGVYKPDRDEANPDGTVLSHQKISDTALAHADLGDQLFKLLADDGAADDWFGFSVAISGATAIVGAWKDDDNGSSSGSAYFFDTTTGRQIMKLLPDDGAASDLFGYSVAISGTTAIVGARGAGSAYLFDTTTGGQIAKLLADDGAVADQFGISVAISGNTAIVGAWLDDDNGALSGSAYLFDTTTGRQIAKLLPNDGAANDLFGESVAISGATAIVGAYLDDDNGSSSGSAYLFDATTGRQIIKLLPNDGAAGHAFGIFVAISGTPGEETAIVGAPFDDDNGEYSGSAYLFDISDPVNPEQIAKLLPKDGAADDLFGFSVAISGATAIVGARFDDDNGGNNSGAAYLFDTTTGDQIAKLLADDGAVGDYFGRSLAISGPPGKAVAIVGALFDDDNGINSGSAYLFDAASTPGSCPWDLDGDGVVNHHDLVEVVHNLGPCDDPDNCPWDINGDGIVNGRDVAAVAMHFGPCP